MEVWTIIFKNQNVPHNENNNTQHKLVTLKWRHNMDRKFYNLVLKSQYEENAKKFIEELYVKSI